LATTIDRPTSWRAFWIRVKINDESYTQSDDIYPQPQATLSETKG